MPTINVEAGSSLQLQEIADILAKSRKVVVITGAGISTNCGIPDFRSENGLYALIQAQYDAAAKAKPVQVETNEDVDEIDDRPSKRRRLSPPAPTMQLRSSRGTSIISMDETSATETSPLEAQHHLRRTRSSNTIIELSQVSAPEPSTARTSSARRSLADLPQLSSQSSTSSNSSRASLPLLPTLSSQTSTSSFMSSSRNSLPNLKGKDLFDSLIWSDPLTTSIFYTFITSLRETIQRDVTETTVTHKFIKSLKDAGRLVRNYTQNIDRLEEREGLCTDLEQGTGDRSRFTQKSQKTMDQAALSGVMGISGRPGTYGTGVECVLLHGSLGSLRCGLCSKLSSWDDEGRSETTLAGEAPDCPHCAANSSHREGKGRRSLAIGRLRPDIVLYGEEHPAAHLISPLVTHDLSLNPDVILILGTSLRVHGLKVMVREFSKAVHGRGGKVIFVNQTKPPDSIWGDVLDYHVQWDCDKWVDDLRERRSDIWLPIPPTERKAREDKPKLPAKNPVATRPDTSSGAYWYWRIIDQLGRLSGRLPDTEHCIVVDTAVPNQESGKRKKNALPRPNAVRDNKENGAYIAWKIKQNLRRLSVPEALTPLQASELRGPLKQVSTNVHRRRPTGKRDSEQLPTPPNSDQDATPPLTPRTRRTKRLCGISALLSSPGENDDTIRVFRDESLDYKGGVDEMR